MCLAAGSVQKFRAGNVSRPVLVLGRESLGALCMDISGVNITPCRVTFINLSNFILRLSF